MDQLVKSFWMGSVKVWTMGLPWCGAGQRLASGTEGDVRRDDREDEPYGQEPPPVKFGGKVERDNPHLEQSHQLKKKKKEQNVGIKWRFKNINTIRHNANTKTTWDII